MHMHTIEVWCVCDDP